MGPSLALKSIIRAFMVHAVGPVVYVKGGRVPCRMAEVRWRMGTGTGGEKVCFVEGGTLQSGDVAECVFEPQHPLVVDCACDCLSQLVFMNHDLVVMVGKAIAVETRKAHASHVA